MSLGLSRDDRTMMSSSSGSSCNIAHAMYKYKYKYKYKCSETSFFKPF
jgi:hypothetical protein